MKCKVLSKGIGVVLLVILANVSFAQRQVVDKVVAMIGGEVVLLSEIEEQLSMMKAQQGGNVPEDIRCQILDQLLVSKLMLNQAKLDSIEVSDAEVEEQLDARINRILDFMNGDLRQFEDYYGQTVGEVKAQFREDLRNQLLTERMQASIMTSVRVTPSEVKDFFNSIPQDSLPYFNAEVEVSEIVYKPKVNAEERQKAIQKLEEIRYLIVEEGMDFAEMARKYSDDGSARAGGDLGWARRGKFVQEFEATAFRLEKEEISKVVETQFGFHLIQMLERRGNSIRTRHILVRPEITEADIEKAYKHLDSIRLALMRDSLADFSAAVQRHSDEDMQSFTNGGRVINQATGNTFFEIGDLDPDIYFAIDTMEVGKITAPFQFRGPSGEIYFRIVKLDSRQPPHKANLRLDYSKIQQAAKDSKTNKFINDWVIEKINSTYLNVDPAFRPCPAIQQKWYRDRARP